MKTRQEVTGNSENISLIAKSFIAEYPKAIHSLYLKEDRHNKLKLDFE